MLKDLFVGGGWGGGPCVSGMLLLLTLAGPARADDVDMNLRKALSLYASFDEEVRMDVGQGSRVPGTRTVDPATKMHVFAEGFDRKYFQIVKGMGVAGGCLQADLPPRSGRLFFPAQGNIAYEDGKPWGGAFSVWVNTDPNRLLRTPFCDPVLITQKGLNNGSIWAHFNDADPRALQAGTYPSIPDGIEPLPEDDPRAPLTRLPRVNFKEGEWHHVVLSWANFNTGKNDGTHTLWVDGKKIGTLEKYGVRMDWDMAKTRVYFAVNLVGRLDELAVFRRPLTEAEVKLLFDRPAVLQKR